MFILLQILTFLIFSFLIFYIPGKFLIEKLRLKLEKLESIVVGILLGIFIFVLMSLLAKLVGLTFFSIVLVDVIFDIFYFKKISFPDHNKFFKEVKNLMVRNIVFVSILIVGIFTQSWVHFNSGIISQNGVSFLLQPFHDAAFHLSFIGELRNHFPPQNPLFTGAPLKNYHYLTDFLIAGISSVLPFSLLDLYFKILPIFVSLYYGLAAYAVSSKFTTKKWTKNLAVFFTYFAGPFSYLIPFFRSGPWNVNSFMINQPFDFSFNSQSLFSLVIFLIGFLLICEYRTQKNKSLIYLSAIVFSFSFGFKSYVSILGMGAFLITSIYILLLKRKSIFIKAFILGMFIFVASSFLLVNNFNNSLRFAPGWTLKRMVEDPDRLYLPNLTLREQHYQSKGNLLRVAQINIEEILLYIFGNLGIRTIGFLYLLSFLRKPFKLLPGIAFAIFITLASIFIPIIFNQGGSAYNIIQFGIYSLVMVSIFSAIILEKIIKRISFFKKPWTFGTLILICVILAIPANIKTFIEQINYKQFLISPDELEVLKYIKNQSPNNSIILLYPSVKNRNYAYVSALTERRTFLSDAVMVEIMNLSYNEREKEAFDFFHKFTFDQQKEFIAKKNISYIYLTKEDMQELTKTNTVLASEPIFQSDSTFLYKTL